MDITYDAGTDKFTFANVTSREASLMGIALGDLTYEYDRNADRLREEGNTSGESIDRNLAKIASGASRLINREVDKRRTNMRARRLRSARVSNGSR